MPTTLAVRDAGRCRRRSGGCAWSGGFDRRRRRGRRSRSRCRSRPRQKATKTSSVRRSAAPVVEHAGRAGRGEHEDVLDPLPRPGRAHQRRGSRGILPDRADRATGARVGAVGQGEVRTHSDRRLPSVRRAHRRPWVSGEHALLARTGTTWRPRDVASTVTRRAGGRPTESRRRRPASAGTASRYWRIAVEVTVDVGLAGVVGGDGEVGRAGVAPLAGSGCASARASPPANWAWAWMP